MNDEVRSRLSDAAARVYGKSWVPDDVVSAPGRIELIGNHLDYNGGPVLAAAINRRISVARRISGSSQISAVFADFDLDSKTPNMVAVDDQIRPMSDGVHPENYLIGALEALDASGIARHSGLDMVIAGDLPHGVGISSSAALCVSLIASLSIKPLAPLEHVRLAREAENRTGSPCGAMDQSASVFGNVIKFDGKDSSVARITADLGDYEFILANSNVVRELGSSSYPIRVKEVQQAVALLAANGWAGLSFLAEIQDQDRSKAATVLESAGHSNLARRLNHVVSETERVARAEPALDASDWVTFGELMNKAGASSNQQYEISHPTVERLVEICQSLPGVLGARMMGGGEGGSVLALIREV